MTDQLLEVGRIGKAHGLRGEVVVTLTTNRLERVAPGAVLHVGDRDLVVASSRPHQGKFVVLFRNVNGRNASEALRGSVLLGAPLEDDDELWVHDLIGSRVVDQHGVDRGEVTSVLANPASDILELAGGALVPLTFLVDGPTDGVITVDTPYGLFGEADGDEEE